MPARRPDRTLIIALLAGALATSACSPRIYGVSEEHWEAMTTAERQEAMRAWEAVQVAREERRRAEAERDAVLQQHAAEQRAALARAIRSGEAGVPGDLIRVRLSGGTLRIGGRARSYAPVAFSLASGETRRIPIVAGRYRSELAVDFWDGVLRIDLQDTHRDTGAAHLAWGPEWHRGTDQAIRSDGPRRLREVQAYIETLPLPGPRHRPGIR